MMSRKKIVSSQNSYKENLVSSYSGIAMGYISVMFYY